MSERASERKIESEREREREREEEEAVFLSAMVYDYIFKSNISINVFF